MRIERKISLWAMVLYRLVLEKPGNIDKMLINLEKSLGRKKIFMPAIIKKFIIIYLRENKAELTLAKDLSGKIKEDIIEKIKKVIGKNAEIECLTDENLLAGFRLKTKDILIKASLKDILQELRNKIYGYN